MQPGAQERERLVVARARRDEVLALGVQPFERLLEGGELEEVAVLLLARQLDMVDRAAVALVDFVIRLEVRAARAVPALVRALVHVPVLAHAREHLLDLRHVLGIGRADEEVVRRAELRHERLEALGVLVGELLRLDPERVRGVGDGLAVLVGARQEEHVLAALAVMTRERVDGDRRVRVPQMGGRVDVVDRGGDVVGHARPRLPAECDGRRDPPVRR